MPRTSQQHAGRVARQYLDSLRRAGVTHLSPAATAPTRDDTSPPSDNSLPESAADLPVEIASAAPVIPERPLTPPAGRSLFADAPPQPQKDSPLLPQTATVLSLAERTSQLKILAERVAACTRCPELARTRTQTVFGVGNPNARVLFLGEAPGADEDRQGEPFVGRAGKLLNDIIAACRWRREEIYICNILRCRPPENRNPTPQEASHCREYLDGQISIVDPDYIVCWGSIAAQNLLDSTLSIGKLRGKFYQYGRAKVLCTYHPAYLLRNPSAKKDTWQDMKFLLRDMGIDLNVK